MAAPRPAPDTMTEVPSEPSGDLRDVRDGLTSAEARERLERFGPNTLPAMRRRGPVARFLLQFHSPLIYVLLASAVVTTVLGDHVDSAVICGVVIVNAIVGFAQEARAEKALTALMAMTSTTAEVVRDGSLMTLPSTELVVGDLVILEAGAKVPADVRLLVADGLEVDEAVLTGESIPSAKDPRPLEGEVPLADRRDMAFSGTVVTRGRGTGTVTATGSATQLGLIHRLVGQAQGVQTPLTRKIAHFSRLITAAVLGLAALTFLIGVLRGQAVAEMLTAAVALAVGAIPEGLPALVTITLAFGVARMVRRNAIIRRLPAVETLGSTTVICTDKTGTLTENRMTVRAIAAGGRLYAVGGTGYAPDGDIVEMEGHAPVALDAHPALAACLTSALACNDAQITRGTDGWEVIGDPTEGALVVSAAKAGITSVPQRLETLPFSSERQYMATRHEDGAVHVKGSIERVLALCDRQLGLDDQREPFDHRAVKAVTELAEAFGRQGLRVLAFARAEAEASSTPLTRSSIPLTRLSHLTFVGLQAMQDPPRQAAADAVRACHDAGIQVKMITGDHAETAAAIGTQVGLHGEVMTGTDIDACPGDRLPGAVERTAVFARVSPAQKLLLVRALQSRAHVIAMTGDGVNDAPALKQADIGVAMGRAGTEVAKEAADMVLTDDDFASIEAAVEEGRGVLDNLVKFIVWALPANIGLGLVLVAAIVTGGELPILPVQVLWLNMTAVLVLGLPFAVEPRDDDIMHRPPRDPRLPLLPRPLVARIMFVSAILLAGAFGLFHWEQAHGASSAEARTVVVSVFAVTLATYLFNCLSLDHPILVRGVRRNPWVGAGVAGLIVIQLIYTYVPVMNDLFRSAPIGLAAWGRALTVAVVSYALVEGAKRCSTRTFAPASEHSRPGILKP
ncbi:HAD-IC family P-type ATPase [Actinomadura barringtoniae]|uniref:HAD-IC family P-type ATPase n=1 Tax=Actinomadura barringtoniae TaxID=1427535 RepID=A0A939PMR6_9ACTN|nr:HAD-IC family P-type ATPase [Actinomadura barringtoniae]MBO2455207.1 HAD-IC family P-type ATPase [Actinomadura barringtoniae]